jgi:hypothetical protein
VTDLAEFLLARIAEDEDQARYLDSEGAEYAAMYGMPGEWQSVGLYDAKRALAECEAKRRIAEEHECEATKVVLAPFDPSTGERRPVEWDLTCRVCGWADDNPSGGCATLKLLALPYADHPDYREDWRA